MKITIDNYEQYVLDFLDGNLTNDEVVMFEAFMDIHPHIKDEIKDVNQFVLIPNEEVEYSDKSTLYKRDRAIIVPFWNNSRMVAAAVALLVVTTTVFFIWKSSLTPSSMPSSDNQLTITNPGINQRNLPNTGIPMSEGQSGTEESFSDPDMDPPELNVMVQQENGSRGNNNALLSSPALASGSLKKMDRSEHPKIYTIDESITKEVIPIRHLEENEYESIVPDPVVSPLPQNNDFVEAVVAFLPPKSSQVAINENLYIPKLENYQPNSESETHIIHIPGQFLSETWTDVSMTDFKKKLIPTFIKNQLNL